MYILKCNHCWKNGAETVLAVKGLLFSLTQWPLDKFRYCLIISEPISMLTRSPKPWALRLNCLTLLGEWVCKAVSVHLAISMTETPPGTNRSINTKVTLQTRFHFHFKAIVYRRLFHTTTPQTWVTALLHAGLGKGLRKGANEPSCPTDYSRTRLNLAWT